MINSVRLTALVLPMRRVYFPIGASAGELTVRDTVFSALADRVALQQLLSMASPTVKVALVPDSLDGSGPVHRDTV